MGFFCLIGPQVDLKSLVGVHAVCGFELSAVEHLLWEVLSIAFLQDLGRNFCGCSDANRVNRSVCYVKK